MGDVRIQAIEDGLTQARGYARCHHIDARPHRIALFSQGIHISFQFRDPVRVGTEEGVAQYLLPLQLPGLDRTELCQVATNLDAIAQLQIFPGDGAGRHPHGGFPGRRTPATPIIPHPVFLSVGVIGMAGPEAIHDPGIIFGTLIGIADDQGDGGAGRPAFEHPGQELDLIRLTALGGVARGARFTLIQVGLNIGEGKLEPGWTAIHDTADGRPMALAKRGDGKQLACGATRHAFYCSNKRLARSRSSRFRVLAASLSSRLLMM